MRSFRINTSYAVNSAMPFPESCKPDDEQEKPMLFYDGKTHTATELASRRAHVFSGLELTCNVRGVKVPVYCATGRPVFAEISDKNIILLDTGWLELYRITRPGRHILANSKDAGKWILRNIPPNEDREAILERFSFIDREVRDYIESKILLSQVTFT